MNINELTRLKIASTTILRLEKQKLTSKYSLKILIVINYIYAEKAVMDETKYV